MLAARCNTVARGNAETLEVRDKRDKRHWLLWWPQSLLG